MTLHQCGISVLVPDPQTSFHGETSGDVGKCWLLSHAINLDTSAIFTDYRVFSLTWPASIQIYWNKRKCLHRKRVQLPQDWFGTPIWPPRRHVKTLYVAESCITEPTLLFSNLTLEK